MGTCAFCDKSTELKVSHVIPAFAYKALRRRSGTAHMRNSENPNRRVQDGLKQPWLCAECEGLFSQFETAFANNVLHPWLRDEQRVLYRDWMLKFAVSVSWRVLKYARGKNLETKYSAEQIRLMDEAEFRWRMFLMGKVPHPASFEQHLVIFDNVVSTSFSDLPQNFNRFMMGAITLDIVGSDRSLMTFAKMGRFMIFGIIQKGSHQWQGTKLHVREGLLEPCKIVIPYALMGLFREKANAVEESMANLSDAQRAKIDGSVIENAEKFAGSDQFHSMMADAEMFGLEAILSKPRAKGKSE